jgi:peptide/nickel transport system ATP-binding protein
MKVSYSVNGKTLVRSAFLPLSPGEVFLLTGTENTAFRLLGGILGRLIPISEELPWPEFQALIKNYTGEVHLEEGTLPECSAYVGPDPDHHLLFSKVREELLARAIATDPEMTAVLNLLGLDASFLDRRIATLSGGERMKLSLALAFSADPSLIVLHGCVPWLDQTGRQRLLEQINRLKERRAAVMLFEHDTKELRETIDRVFSFDGETTTEIAHSEFFGKPATESAFFRAGSRFRIRATTADPLRSIPILELHEVTLHQHPEFEVQRPRPLIDRASFAVYAESVYALGGDNGMGKSTLAQIVLRLVQPDSGKVRLCGRDLSSFTRHELMTLISYVGQFPEKQLICSNIGQYKQRAMKAGNIIALELLDTNLPLPDEYPISLLSPLQIKLLCLLSSVTKDTKLIILDEPTWGLDNQDKSTLVDILSSLSERQHHALFIVSHDFTFLSALDAQVARMDKGLITPFQRLGAAP